MDKPIIQGCMTVFKVFLSFLIFFAEAGRVCAQTDFSAIKEEQEKTLNKYINASAVCAKMTDSNALYERGMLLLNDANDEAYLAAADCFTSAAMKNHTPSQLELGKLYEYGNGVSKSIVYAYKWYQTAVLLGNDNARPFRDRLEAQMSLDELSAANPMIQTTLDLIETISQSQEMEIQKLEAKIAQEYLNFGVDISQYDIKEEGKSSYDNPLINALIREQKKKNNVKKQQNGQDNVMPDNSENQDPAEETPRRRGQRRR